MQSYLFGLFKKDDSSEDSRKINEKTLAYYRERDNKDRKLKEKLINKYGYPLIVLVFVIFLSTLIYKLKKSKK